MESMQLWSAYIRYIGAGAVAAAGLISLIKTMPMIISMVKDNINSVKNKSDSDSEDSKDLPMWIVLAGVAIIGVVVWLTPAIPVNIIGMIIILVLGFFFCNRISKNGRYSRKQ